MRNLNDMILFHIEYLYTKRNSLKKHLSKKHQNHNKHFYCRITLITQRSNHLRPSRTIILALFALSSGNTVSYENNCDFFRN